MDEAVPIWEIWNWTDEDRVLFGVALLLVAAFGAGWLTRDENKEHSPKIVDRWQVIVFVSLIVGVGLLIWKPR